eukprot:1101175-Rhodomonas_salina.1
MAHALGAGQRHLHPAAAERGGREGVVQDELAAEDGAEGEAGGAQGHRQQAAGQGRRCQRG